MTKKQSLESGDAKGAKAGDTQCTPNWSIATGVLWDALCSEFPSRYEPMNLTEWRPPRPYNGATRLFTCGLPGRGTFEQDKIRVDDDTIDKWVNGLPRAKVLYIISLLRHKTSGLSEFDYYPFRSSMETGPKPTFQEWFDERCGRRFVVHEFTTVDAPETPSDVLKTVKRLLIELIENGSTIVVIDAAGAEKTAKVCEGIGYKRVVQSDVT